MPENNNGWAEWGKHVLLELERLNTSYSSLDSKMNDFFIKYERETAKTHEKNSTIVQDISTLKTDVNNLKSADTTISGKVGYTEGKLMVWDKIWLYVLTAVVIGYFMLKFFKVVV